MYKAAIIGISGFGEIHYRDLVSEVNNGNVQLIGATVINQEEETEKCTWLKSQGTTLFSDWQEMLFELKGQIDLCFIPTGIPLHTSMSIAALEAGANVFVEKPVAGAIQDVRLIEKASIRHKRFVAVGYQNIYLPETVALKRFLVDGKLGEIKQLKSFAMWPRNSIYYNRNNWAGRLRCNNKWVLDSPFNNALAHFLNLLCFFAGNTINSSAELNWIEAELCRANSIESCDTATLRLKTRNGKELFFCATHACKQNIEPSITIIGTKGKVSWNQDKTVIKYNNGSSEDWQNTPASKYRQYIMEALFKRLSNPTAFICSLQIAAVQTIAANGAHESSFIHNVPSCCKLTKENSNNNSVIIKNIAPIIKKCHAAAQLFSEAGVSWSSPGKRISLRNYSTFYGDT